MVSLRKGLVSLVACSTIVLASGCSTLGGVAAGGVIGHQSGRALEGGLIGGVIGGLLERNRMYDDRPIERDDGYQLIQGEGYQQPVREYQQPVNQKYQP